MAKLTKSIRLARLVEELRARKAGLTVAEMARTAGVHPRSIQRDLNAIQYDLAITLTKKDDRYRIGDVERLAPLDLELQEARAMLIATRLFLRYSDETDAAATNAIRKLARIMPAEVRPQVMAAADALSVRPPNNEFSRVLVVVTEAWSRRRMLRLSYRSAGKQQPKKIEIAPYFLEPSAAGFSTYVIGYSRTHNQMRTLKVERIVSAEKLPETFEIPPEVDLDGLLASAWGIIWGEGTIVRIRFKPDVAWRVRESTWHPTQSLEELDGGGVLMTVTVSTTMEIGRWVRGWGDKAEVLEPITLREELRDEAVRLARQYTAKVRVEKKRRVAKKSVSAPKPLQLLGDQASSE